ncbi:arabinogalactan protein 13-like [Benincasa hispida]|uniref:arabinogalactan protein 13-like n=1 Tax=Benincasa hispida TaxID=102211 RepID=UPI0019024931|nr:arabinogalactan protein 13-like [Benincasa hispida]
MEAMKSQALMMMIMVVVLMAFSSSSIVAAQEAPAPSPASDAPISLPTLMASLAPLVLGFFL